MSVEFNASFLPESEFTAKLQQDGDLNAGFGEVTRIHDGTSDYNKLSNKPKINGVELIGDKSGPDLKLQDKMEVATVQEIEAILYLD